VAHIHKATAEVMQVMDGIGLVINEMGQISTSMAYAVEQQGAATGEIARNVQQAAAGTEEITGRTDQVDRAVTETGQAAREVLGVAGEVPVQANRLEAEFRRLIDEVRAA
jgi:methyl-accepting chemotaxis protein